MVEKRPHARLRGRLRKAAETSKEAFKIGKTIREVAREQTDLSEEELDEALDAKKMTGR